MLNFVGFMFRSVLKNVPLEKREVLNEIRDPSHILVHDNVYQHWTAIDISSI